MNLLNSPFSEDQVLTIFCGTYTCMLQVPFKILISVISIPGPLKSEPVVSGGPGQVDVVQRVLLCVSLIRLQMLL